MRRLIDRIARPAVESVAYEVPEATVGAVPRDLLGQILGRVDPDTRVAFLGAAAVNADMALDAHAVLADIGQYDSHGRTALINAARNNDGLTARALLATDPRPDQVDADGRTPLIHAAMGNNVDALRELLAAGASLDHADPDGHTAMFHAAMGNNVDALRELRLAGASLNHQDSTQRTAVMLAAAAGHVASVRELLLDAALALDTVDYAGRNVVTHAAIYGHASVIEALANPRPPAVQNEQVVAAFNAPAPAFNARAPAFDALAAALEEADLLIDDVQERPLLRDEVLNHQDDQGMTALHHAVSQGEADAVEALLAAGAEINIVNQQGQIPLDLAGGDDDDRITHALRAAADMVDEQNAEREQAGNLEPGAGIRLGG